MGRNFKETELFEALLGYLSGLGPTKAKDAIMHLGISQPVFSRLVKKHKDAIIVMGRARSTLYAARRQIPLVGERIPIYEIDQTGHGVHVAMMHSIQPRGFLVEPLVKGFPGGFFDDLPYFLYDMIPAGFLGRSIPARHPELDLKPDIKQWSSDECLRYLTRYGWNSSGNLIVGEIAFQLYLSKAAAEQDLVRQEDRDRRYPMLAETVLSGGSVGSSTAGDQPKFLATTIPGPGAVLVKFSPPAGSETSQRIADLLICEHLAHEFMASRRLPAARSDLLFFQDRVFLEVERFDRTLSLGRRGILSLTALDLQFVGQMKSWTDTCEKLFEQGKIDDEILRQISWLQAFGRLMGNTDMHLGNISFFVTGGKITALAPVYDMLPMMYMPIHGHMTEKKFSPSHPRSREFSIWDDVCEAARQYWSMVSAHPKISESFRKIAACNAEVIESLFDVGRLLPH